MKTKIAILIIMASLFLGGCDVGKNEVIEDIKYDLSVEYKVPISDIEVEDIEYGVTRFTTNQFKATIESKGIKFYLIDKDASNSFRRIPIEE